MTNTQSNNLQSSSFKLNEGIEKLKNFLETLEKHSSTGTSSLTFSGISSPFLNYYVSENFSPKDG